MWKGLEWTCKRESQLEETLEMVSFASGDCWPFSLRSESMWRFVVNDCKPEICDKTWQLDYVGSERR